MSRLSQLTAVAIHWDAVIRQEDAAVLVMQAKQPLFAFSHAGCLHRCSTSNKRPLSGAMEPRDRVARCGDRHQARCPRFGDGARSERQRARGDRIKLAHHRRSACEAIDADQPVYAVDNVDAEQVAGTRFKRESLDTRRIDRRDWTDEAFDQVHDEDLIAAKVCPYKVPISGLAVRPPTKSNPSVTRGAEAPVIGSMLTRSFESASTP